MTWYWLLRHRKYRVHPRGIAHYGDKASTLIAADGLADLHKAQGQIHDLLAACRALARKIQQKWNKLRDLGAADAPFASPLKPEEYESLTLRINRGRWLLAGLVLGETFLNYLALMVIIPSDDPFMIFVRFVIAAIVTLVSFRVFHYTLEAWARKESELGLLQSRIASTAFAIVTLVAIAGVTIARARDFEGGSDGQIGIIGVGFILISLLLPIIGGEIDRELGLMRPTHKRLRKWRASLKELRGFEAAMQKDLTQIDNLLKKAETRIREHSERMYAGVVDFRVSKNNLDARRGKEQEDVAGTSAESAHSFLTACLTPFDARKDEYVASIMPSLQELQALVRRSIEGSAALVSQSGITEPSASATPSPLATAEPVE